MKAREGVCHMLVFFILIRERSNSWRRSQALQPEAMRFRSQDAGPSQLLVAVGRTRQGVSPWIGARLLLLQGRVPLPQLHWRLWPGRGQE